MPKTTLAEQINLAQAAAMEFDPNMICCGLGIDDPKGIFGTTNGLAEQFGGERVFDMPTAENAMTGIGIGAAIAGTRVLMTHQRLDFFLLAMDQLVNNAAKWHYMFNGQMKVPLTIRLIIGRGWGQGPTHAQNLQSWFAHVPGLKVLVLSRAESAAQQLYQAIMDNNPVVVIEHRWLHQQQCEPQHCLPLEQPTVSCSELAYGDDITVVANSYMSLEAIRAAQWLRQQGISCHVIDLSELHAIDWPLIYASVNKTGRLLVCDSAREAFSIASEVVASVAENCFGRLKAAPARLGLPDYPEPTSYGLTKDYYNGADNIIKSVSQLMGRDMNVPQWEKSKHDIPGDWFKGPF